MAEKQQMPPSTASFKASGMLEEVWLLATSREDEEPVRINVAHCFQESHLVAS